MNDTVPKLAARRIGNAKLVGIAKGVGMIEPNMATLLAFFFTDAAISKDVLPTIFRPTIDKTFNCLSIDTDTSTSDSAVILANGLAGEVETQEFTYALQEIAHELVLAIAQDGEGANKVIEVTLNLHILKSLSSKAFRKLIKMCLFHILRERAIAPVGGSLLAPGNLDVKTMTTCKGG
jgi:glutamate N-acetyltransferase/amino-acid N-acetyltransferase